MKTFKKETAVKYDVVDKVFCDKCGKEVGSRSKKKRDYDSLDFIFGFGSSRDGTSVNVDICADCMIKFVDTLKHKPEGWDTP